MLDLLSPLRGYIAQTLQFYLSKYIEDIQLEGLGLFGGDLVLNDLKLKRHVLRESLEIPSSFDFSRGFIRELRIQIPWTQLLSQSIAIKLYTVELILTGKNEDEQSVTRDGIVATLVTDGKEQQEKIEHPKSGWIYDTLQKILANVSVQLNNLVLKYEHDDVVFSITLGTLHVDSACEKNGWKQNFEELKGGHRVICKRIDAKDVTIFLDRYTSDGHRNHGMKQDSVRRNVIGYEMPVLSRTSVSIRAKLQLFTSVAANTQDICRSNFSSSRSPVRRDIEGSVIDVDGLFKYRPSVMCDPFYYYSCSRSRVSPMYEVDVFIGELFFSVSDRQLEMLNQLIKCASLKMDQAHHESPQKQDCHCAASVDNEAKMCYRPSDNFTIPHNTSHAEDQKVNESTNKQESWFGWAMNALRATEDETEDELVSELLAETRGAMLLKVQERDSNVDEDLLFDNDPIMKTLCARLCVSTVSLILRKHGSVDQANEHEEDITLFESGEELVPVANLGLVKVMAQRRKREIARPAVPILSISLSHAALEVLLPWGKNKTKQSEMDLVFEIAKAELASATVSDNREGSKCKKGQVLLTWGSVDEAHFCDCVSHPYFANSFFGEEMTRLNQREKPSFEPVKASLDSGICFKEALKDSTNAGETVDFSCDCFTTWNGERIHCIPIATVYKVCHDAIRCIGIKERFIDDGILSNAVSSAWASSGFRISISEGMTRDFISAADEYRAYRNPDVGAMDNLMQLLQPHLAMLLSRYTLHSCAASSPYAFSRSTNIRHRSVHSALRLRLAFTSDLIDHNESSRNVHIKEERACKVLDISISDIDAVLEPSKCLEIMEALSIFQRRSENEEGKTGMMGTKLLPPVTVFVTPNVQSVIKSDVTLFTIGSVHIRLPNQAVEPEQDELEPNCRGDLNVTARDFVWLKAFHPGNSENHLQLGASFAHMGRLHKNTTPSMLVEALGLDVMMTKTSGGDNDGVFTRLNKLKVNLTMSVAHYVASLVNNLSSPLGYPIAWLPLSLTSKTLRTTFQIEACGTTLSRIVSNRPRLLMAQRQSLSAEIASVSVSLIRIGSKSESSRLVLQGGVAPMVLRGSKFNAFLFKLDISQEKSSGVLHHVPLSHSLGLFSLNPGSDLKICTHCQIAVNAQLARVSVDVQGVLELVGAMLGLAQGVMADFLPRIKLNSPDDDSELKAQEKDCIETASTGWSLTIDLKAAGGDIRVNEALQLTMPLVSVSSVEMDTGLSTQAKPGGVLKIECIVREVTVSVSESGVLQGLEDQRVLSIQDVRLAVDFSHSFVDCRHASTVDISLYVSTIQASLSRLKVSYLLKLPFVKVDTQARNRSFAQTPQSQKKDDYKIGSGAATRSQWRWNLGVQCDHVGASCTADIGHQLADRSQQIRAVVDSKVLNIAVAARIGNYHPIKNQIQPAAGCGSFTDIQASIGDIQIVERLHSAEREVCTAFGEFSRLPEHAFLGILVCLDVSDLKHLLETFSVSRTRTIALEEQALHSPILSWYLTSCIARVFQEANAERKQREASIKCPTAEIPLIIAWSDRAQPKTTHSFPLLSGFYRNYSEAGLPRHVVAGSVESVDVAVTTSSLYCLASVMDVRGKMPNSFKVSARAKEAHNDFKLRAQTSPGTVDQGALADMEVSLLCGQIRLILPSESTKDAIILARPVSGNILVVMESLSVVSAVRSEISLERLGYPPFNARVLPRRPTVQAQRFGQSQMRIGCRAGKISGFVAKLQFGQAVSTTTEMVVGKGPFEDYIGHVLGYPAYFLDMETFWLPLNVTCSLEEEPFAANEVDQTRMKCIATVALTKFRLDLRKPTYDVLATRILAFSRGISVLSRSIVPPSQTQLKPVEFTESQEPFSVIERKFQREVSLSCDGVEVNVFETNESTHVRIGAITLRHNISTLAGSASIQNLVMGRRTIEGAQNLAHNHIAVEDVVFGANAEPSLWQLSVENYPEKLIVARWNFGDRVEGTLFVDVQSYQLHVSHHLILGLSCFVHVKPTYLFSESYREVRVDKQVKLLKHPKPFVLHPKWNIKVLVSPGVMSYWTENPMKRERSGVWLTSGQLFVSIGIGSRDKVQQSLLTCGQTVNEITRFVDVPTVEAMITIDKLGINTSNDLPLLQVRYQNSSVAPIPTSSTWLQFSKYISAVSETQQLLQNCSVQITGVQHQILERVLVEETEVCLLYTDMARLSIQAEASTLCVKVSSSSLKTIQSLLTVHADRNEQCDNSSHRSLGSTREIFASETFIPQSHEPEQLDRYSGDDFKMLRRVTEGRRPSPGELVFTEAILIETQGMFSANSSPIAGMNVQIQIDPNKFDIKLADVLAYLKDCNEPWTVEDHELGGERSFFTGVGSKTHSWMGMRWCYHIPRRICKIEASPVPIPPTGVPNGWPSWRWNRGHNDDIGRLCDIFCQLRCWDSRRKCYAVISEFYIPWELALTNKSSGESDDGNEVGSFGELMSQWFDDGMDEAQHRSKMLEFGARPRVFLFDSDVSSDSWELRWRTPLKSEQESENKQRRLVVNALLASSLQVNSLLIRDAYQRVVASISLPQIVLSVTYADSRHDSHDIVTAELNDTVISCVISGSYHNRTLNAHLSSSMQAYIDNIAQLLTVSVLPQTSIDVMTEISPAGLELSTLIGPVCLYLNQTTMLVISAIPKLLQADWIPSYFIGATPDERLANMRIRIVNSVGMDIWYRQEGTSECLLLATDTSAAYSWLSLANSPFYQLCFAMDDPGQQLSRLRTSKNKQRKSKQPTREGPRWCDPCRIKENAVTGRYFNGRGFLWICVELSGLQTIVTLRASLIVKNYCGFPVLTKLMNEEALVVHCKRLDNLFPDTHTLWRGHSNCISLDGSECTLSATAKVDDGTARVMLEYVKSAAFGIDGGSWCSVSTQENVPNEFDLVKTYDDQAESLKRTQCSFAALTSKHSTQYAWVMITRAQCRTVLPTDFDLLQPQVSRRYTWMEISLWPAISVENIMDIPILLSLSQKTTTIKLKLAPSSKECLSAINPFELVDVKLQYDQSYTMTQVAPKPQAFSLECIANKDTKEQIFNGEGCKVTVNFCNDRCPMVQIRTERILTVANMTPSVLTIGIDSPLVNQRSVEKIESCVERSVGFSMINNFLMISLATATDSNTESDQMEWSPEVLLNVKGDTRPIVIPFTRNGLTSLASAYCMEMVNSNGYLKLIIRPQVVVINSTNCALMCVPTDSQSGTIIEKYETSVIAGNNAGWCVPVCLHKETKKRSITADVSSWLRSKLSSQSSEDMSTTLKHAHVVKLSCSFRLSLVEDGYVWSEEISVLIPQISLLLYPGGKLKVDEAPLSSTLPSNTNDLYPASSTTTRRRRLLIRHRDFRHKMLTYTMTQKGKSIHILFFVDHQPPVVIHNQWQRRLGFQNVSFSSDPEGVGANFCLEYDWSLQVSSKQTRPKRKPVVRNSESNSKDADADYRLLDDWLEASRSFKKADMSGTANDDRTRFQIGLPQYGWSNALWQVSGIQFASFTSEKGGVMDTPTLTFLVMCSYRAGSWLITITCLEDPTRKGHASRTAPLVLPSMLSPSETLQILPTFLRVGLVVEELSFHFCDEYDPVRDDRGIILYPEIIQATCNTVSIVFVTAPDPPEASRHSTRLGYLSHVRSYTTLFISVEDVEVRHFLQICNFPVILCFPKNTRESKELAQIDRVEKHESLRSLTSKLLDEQVPRKENACLLFRVIYADAWNPVEIPSYFHSIELHLSPVVLQVEDNMLLYVTAFIRPMLDALEGESAFGLVYCTIDKSGLITSREDIWSLHAYESAAISKQCKVYIEHFEISNLDVTVTARMAIPVLNSFDGTPLHFESTKMRNVFSFPDQLYKDLAANYVADTIVRSPILLMSLNIIGNPAGFLRSFSQGVRDLVEIPLTASRNGYSPWVLIKGVMGGVASFLGHTAAATLTSVSGFSYSISHTMDQLTLPSDQLRKHHYTRPSHLSSALADGLGSLGSSVVGAAAGVITTPIALYKERTRQGLSTGIQSIASGVGMGLVGIVARPMGGVASLVSMASDGLLYGINVLPDAVGNSLIFAHGIWTLLNENKLVVSGQSLEYITMEQLEASENELLRSVLLPGDKARHLVQVTVVCSKDCLYVVGTSGTQNQAVLAQTRLESIEAVEESLREPTIFDLGVKTPTGVEWLRFRLPPRQRRLLSHQLRLWLAGDFSLIISIVP
ncbi:unnamed protein product [Peronospora belbahrii]|uniref:Chorein N-terminal domain-containing protein n=1 Tax=Peronospora belbahrii TaxID=622444 RepID=A0ABN8CWF2_9STRA|nr:unnamed protein product [Peronospora belbahrii]